MPFMICGQQQCEQSPNRAWRAATWNSVKSPNRVFDIRVISLVTKNEHQHHGIIRILYALKMLRAWEKTAYGYQMDA